MSVGSSRFVRRSRYPLVVSIKPSQSAFFAMRGARGSSQVYVENRRRFRPIFTGEISLPVAEISGGRMPGAISMRQIARDRMRACGIALVALLGIAIGGCKPRTAYEFDALDFTPAQDELSEFSLGHYDIPIPVAKSDGDGESRNRLEFTFDLYALVAPSYESEMHEVVGAARRKNPRLRDSRLPQCLVGRAARAGACYAEVAFDRCRAGPIRTKRHSPALDERSRYEGVVSMLTRHSSVDFDVCRSGRDGARCARCAGVEFRETGRGSKEVRGQEE